MLVGRIVPRRDYWRVRTGKSCHAGRAVVRKSRYRFAGNEYMEDSVRVQMPSISASYGGRIARDTNGMPERIEGVFSQAGMSLPLNLEPGTPVRYRPQTPAPPYLFFFLFLTFSGFTAAALPSSPADTCSES